MAGTEDGITALQMDIKIKGITAEIMSEGSRPGQRWPHGNPGQDAGSYPGPRPELKPHVPRITIIKIPMDKIGAIIGPGGKNIRALQEETNTKIDIEDDGTVFIAATDGKDEAAARERIEALTETPQLGRIYTGKVVRVADFGAFVEILPNIDGMVHISQLDTERVKKVEDVAHWAMKSPSWSPISTKRQDPPLPPGCPGRLDRRRSPGKRSRWQTLRRTPLRWSRWLQRSRWQQ